MKAPSTTTVTIKVTADERKRWAVAAHDARHWSLSAWAREVLHAASTPPSGPKEEKQKSKPARRRR